MTRNARRTATPWRRRYMVQTWPHRHSFEVVLVRGRAKRLPDGNHKVMVKTNADRWEWYTVSGYADFDHPRRKFYKAEEQGEMLAYIAALRVQGHTLIGTMPSW